jgi:hypothetical protein
MTNDIKVLYTRLLHRWSDHGRHARLPGRGTVS